MFKRFSQVSTIIYFLSITLKYTSQDCTFTTKSEDYFPECACFAEYSLYNCSRILLSSQFEINHNLNILHDGPENSKAILLERIEVINSDIRDLEIKAQDRQIEEQYFDSYDYEMKTSYSTEKISIWCHTIEIHDTLLENITFTNVYYVRKVLLNSNRFQKILQKVFSTLVDLEHLDLSHNLITEIEPNSFDKNCKLKELILYSNNIKIISYIFISTTPVSAFSSLSLIDLSNNPLDAFEITSGTHLKTLKINNASVSDNFLTKIGDSWQSLKIENLEMSHNNLSYFPDDFLRSLYNLKILNMSYNMIDIDEFSLLGLGRLQELYLDHNRITRIKKQNFIKFRSLEILNLSHNLISHIESDSFYQTENIYLLILSYNKITLIPQDLFKNFTKIRELDMSHNLLSELNHVPLFNETPTIEKLFLSNNHITVIKENLFFGQILLEHLDLSYNKIEVIDPNAFNDLKMLKKIYLNDNNIKDLPDNLFINQNALIFINISNNPTLNSLSDNIFTAFVSIEEICIDNVNQSGETLIFAGENLTTLSVTRNKLEKVNSSSFIELVNLKYLDLSFNNLNVIENEAFDCLQALSVLNLHHNRLSNFSASIFLNMTFLTYLDLSFNQIDTLPYGLLDWTVNLKVLNVSNNHLTRFEKLNFHSLKNLRILNIESNQISSIDGINALENLQKIYIHNNRWNCEKLYQFIVQLRELNIESVESIGSNYSRPTAHHIKGVSCDGSYSILQNSSNERNQVNNLSNIINIINKKFEGSLQIQNKTAYDLRYWFNDTLKIFRNMSQSTESLNYSKHLNDIIEKYSENIAVLKNNTFQNSDYSAIIKNNTSELVSLRRAILMFMNQSINDERHLNDALKELSRKLDEPAIKENTLEIKKFREAFLKFTEETKESPEKLQQIYQSQQEAFRKYMVEFSSNNEQTMTNKFTSSYNNSSSPTFSYVFLVLGLGIISILGGLLFIFMRTKLHSMNNSAIPLT